MTHPHDALQAAIEALQSQRALLGDAVVESALATLRERLAQPDPARPEPPVEQVRKQVSVLFMDVVGSTLLSRQLEPEQVHEVLDGLLRRCSAVVQRHGGRVLQYAGDALLAAFGADMAQEQDALQAVRAGLALLEQGRRLGAQVLREHGHAGCDVRVGIHTGAVLLGGGVDEAGTIRGAAVNIAARMEQTAPPGRLRISHDTWLLVRDATDVETQPPLLVKGYPEPLQTYLVSRVLPEADRRSGAERSLVALVGRDDERQRLLGLQPRVAQLGMLQAMTVIGEPGIGKSRLVRELQRARDAMPHRGPVLQARAQPTSRLQPYGLLRQLVMGASGLVDGEDTAQARERLVDGLTTFLGEGAGARAALIGQLVGFDFASHPALQAVEPSALRQRAFAALHDGLRGLGGPDAPPLLVIEDLHWADEGSLDFVQALLADAAAPPVAVVVTSRPELLERRPAWAEATALHAVCRLRPLEPLQARTLAQALAKDVQGDVEVLTQHLVRLAEGNPYFLEELFRMCVDQGVVVPADDGWRVEPSRLADARLPTTLIGALQARLELLAPSERRALQQASVVGHVFWDQALASIDPAATAALPALHRRQLVQPRERSAFDDSAEQTFHHHLLHQVAYDTVLRAQRQTGHAAVAAWLAERLAGRPAEFLSLTALHCERAGDLVRAAALYERAAIDAASRHANADAGQHAEHALRCTEAGDLRRRFQRHGLALRAADMGGQRAVQQTHVQARLDLAGALADEALLAEATMDSALLASRRGDEHQALALAERAADLAERSGAIVPGAMARAQIAWCRHVRGEAEEALTQAEQAVAASRRALERADTLEGRTLLVKTLTMLAITMNGRGMLRRAIDVLHEALRGAMADGLRAAEANLRLTLGTSQTALGHLEGSLPHLQAAAQLAAEIGWPSTKAVASWNQANVLNDLGRHDEAWPLVREALAQAQACEAREVIGRCHQLRGQLHAAQGDATAAHRAYTEALAVFEAAAMPMFACHPCAALAEAELSAGNLAGACAWAERAAGHLSGAAPDARRRRPAWPLLVCHRVWAAAGDPRAEAALDEAYAEVQALASEVGDDEGRRGVLEGVPAHREVIAAWRARGRAG